MLFRSFNENVRSAEDAFRCHNEFVRDAANASKLQLTASEWRSFFGEDSGKPSVKHDTDSQKKRVTAGLDVLGEMTDKELAMFRTTWCAKRYDHDHYLCGFAHPEVDGGWLRRNPQVHPYRAEMCPDVITVQNPPLTGGIRVTIHLCSKGENCPLAHSKEEIAYHPSNYKKNPCPLVGSPQGCALVDVCPNLHHQDAAHNVRVAGADHHHQQRHPTGRLQQHSTHESHTRAGRPAAKATPSGVPTLYALPAPFSAFERQLHMPGLQSLFRRRSSVLCSYLDTPTKTCTYTNFGREGDTGAIVKPSPNKNPRMSDN